MSDKYIVNHLADYYSSLKYKSLPQKIIIKARKSLLDFIGVVTIGYRKGVLPPIIDKLILSKYSREESTWLSRDIKTSASDAALSMGVASHAVELDDGYRFGTCHPAVVIIPAVLAVAERESKSFTEIIKAIIIGYDAMLRISRAINPSHWQRGYHSTSTCGVIGSAFACSALLGLNATQTAHAASIGALQSSGLQEMLHSNPAIKPYQVGKASSNGVVAADLAALGAFGPKAIFEGKHGWLKAMTDNYRLEDIFSGLGSEFEIMKTYTKLYPTCRHCHPAIELALLARQEIGLSIEMINSITVKTYDIAIEEVGNIYYPVSYDDAMFSLPFSVALALKNGKVSLNDYQENQYSDERIKKVQGKIAIEADKQMNSNYPEKRGASMKIKMKNGSKWEEEVELPKGEPEKPLTDEELINKLKDCMMPNITNVVIEDIWAKCVIEDVQKVKYDQIINMLNDIASE